MGIPDRLPAVPWREMAFVFGRIGVLSFGGPAAQIALMHRELVEERRWLSEPQFGGALSFCMLLPGPEAMQLATYAGWRLRGVPGGLMAGLLFVLPGAVLIFSLTAVYVAYGDVPWIEAAFLGIKAAVVVIVVDALRKIARRALTTPGRWAVASTAFAAIFLFDVPFPVIVAAAATYGWLTAAGTTGAAPAPERPRTFLTVAVWGAVWLLPLLALRLLGPERLWEIGAFFAKLAVVTFGGAYAVLAWMAQEAVETKGWLTAEQMVDALGLAETTPGPLILVTQFVGTLAALPGGPWMALAAGLVTLHATFAPCFLWIFAGAPWLETITARPRPAAALGAVTAAVVGVILDLSMWFAAHVFFDRQEVAATGPIRILLPSEPDSIAMVLAALSALALFVLRWPLVAVLGAAALGSMLLNDGGVVAAALSHPANLP